MPRRKKKHITGLSWSGKTPTQTAYFVFQCLKSGCGNFLTIKCEAVDEKKIRAGKLIARCSECGFSYSAKGIQNFVEESFQLSPEELDEMLARSNFDIKQAAEDYLIHFFQSQPHWKYCSICETLKPLTSFHKHSRTPTGRQHECSTCKNRVINTILNPLRTIEQLREGAEGRRLYFILMGKEKMKISQDKLLKKFQNKCFRCGVKVNRKTKRMDHTLPAKLLWPLGIGPTVLCKDCNDRKAERWPSEFYSDSELKKLSAKTGIRFSILKGKPHLYPEAVRIVKSEGIDKVVEQATSRPEYIVRLRKLFQDYEGIDVLDYLQEYDRRDIEKLIEEI